MKNPYHINPVLEFLVRVWMFFFTWRYNIKVIGDKKARNAKGAYFLVSNHAGDYDPFIISYFMRKRAPSFVASDAVLRDKMGTALKKLGAIPKRKGVKDTAVIREMKKAIDGNGPVGLFPEGSRTWTGETHYIDPAMAKLIRLLNVPVISVCMRGAFAYDPRWGNGLRKTSGVTFEIKEVFKKGEARKHSEAEILEKVNNNLYYNFYDEQRTANKIKVFANNRAEYLDFLLFACPSCNEFSHFSASGNHVSCKNCQSKIFVDEYMFLKSTDEQKPLEFDNLIDWNNWQNQKFVEWLFPLLEKHQHEENELFASIETDFYFSADQGEMQPKGRATLHFLSNGIRIKSTEKEAFYSFADVDILSPQFNERLELSAGGFAYRFVSGSEKEPGVKWELAFSLAAAHLGQNFKVSPYFQKHIDSVLKE